MVDNYDLPLEAVLTLKEEYSMNPVLGLASAFTIGILPANKDSIFTLTVEIFIHQKKRFVKTYKNQQHFFGNIFMEDELDRMDYEALDIMLSHFFNDLIENKILFNQLMVEYD